MFKIIPEASKAKGSVVPWNFEFQSRATDI